LNSDAKIVPTSQLSLARDGEAGVFRPPRPRSLVDGERRAVGYLRLSVTDRCNYRCVYCMPAEGVPFVPRAEVLSFEELTRLTRCFVHLGIRRVRLTGGEPLLRKDVVSLVASLAALDGVEDVAMTTNGHLLAANAAALAAAGLERVNVSLDTLRPDRFAKVTRTGTLERVLAGLDAAEAAGLTPVKINAVVVKGFNDDELVDLVHFAAARRATLRFIEYMPIGVDGFWSSDTFVSTAEMIAHLAETFDVRAPLGYAAAVGVAGGGPAVYRDLSPHGGGAATRVGFISALSHNFCATCNRVRLSAIGTLQECLAYPGSLSLRDAMRAGASDEAIVALIERALFAKGPGHSYDGADGPLRTLQPMSVIGG
jgi:cyclic pyranopterin phosphate synthase